MLAIHQTNHLNLEQEIGGGGNDDSRETHNVNSQIKFKTAILVSSLCDYSDAYILVKRLITIPNTEAVGVASNNRDKKVIFKNCAPFAKRIIEINNTQVDSAKDIDVIIKSEVNLLLTWSANYFVMANFINNQEPTFAITDTKLCVPVVT